MQIGVQVMTFNQKETGLLQDLKAQEQLCVEKYTRYSTQACDEQLKTLFTKIGQTEQQHLDTVNQMLCGTVPEIGAASQSSSTMTFKENMSIKSEDKQKDSYLCSDTLATEKHASSSYNTSIFEFRDEKARDVLNHLQTEEQQHGEEIYNYMAANGMYRA